MNALSNKYVPMQTISQCASISAPRHRHIVKTEKFVELENMKNPATTPFLYITATTLPYVVIIWKMITFFKRF